MTKQNGKIDNSKSKMQNKDSKNNNNSEFQWKRAGKTSFIWVFILITAIFLSGLFTSADQKLWKYNIINIEDYYKISS